ncbi:MAG: hypothetical protein M5U14_14625 [Acidimicrobiia bacterium]|nr:hypothetical protein [Acidimicrobiia bacterium]
MKTTTFATAGVTGAVLVLLVLLAVPAGAALYPSGCDEWADSQPSNSSWSDNCWLSTSPSHDSAGNYVTGVQRLLAAEGRYGGPSTGCSAAGSGTG